MGLFGVIRLFIFLNSASCCEKCEKGGDLQSELSILNVFTNISDVIIFSTFNTCSFNSISKLVS